jgi:hypothetical protein
VKRAQHALERSAAVLAANAVVRDRAEHARWECRIRALRAAERPTSVDPLDDEILRRSLVADRPRR